MNKESILLKIQENRKIIDQFGVTRLCLFGSVVRGEQTADSDLDFLVEFRHKTFDAYMGLKEYLEDIFNCKVDLVMSNTIKPRLRSYILEELVDAA